VDPLPPETHIGAVALTVRDLDRSLDFYENTMGLRLLAREGDEAAIGADGRPLLELHADPEAPERPRHTTGLFHFAVLVPSRRDLARWLARVAERRWPLTGASDHLVSEAIYLNDPDGIGIEVYRDRPRSEWQRRGDEIAMATIPLDLDGVLGELGADAPEWKGMDPATVMGHVHLNVADIGDSERFYCDELGFDVIVRSYPGALFVSAGGYHHHLGLNVWNGQGVPAPPAGAVGLRHFEIVVPGGDGTELTDPAGNRVLLRGG
jgi:catechol 2,3-dioxygenase